MELFFSGQSGTALYRDLIWIDGVLVGTTRAGGSVDSWTANLAAIDSYSYTYPDAAGLDAYLTPLQLQSGAAVLLGGGDRNSLQLLDVSGGTLSLHSDLGTFGWGADMVAASALVTGNGTISVFGGLTPDAGTVALQLGTDGAVIGDRTYADTNQTFSADITATTTVSSGGSQYLITAALEENGVTVWSVQPDGTLSDGTGYNASDGLWVSAPTAIEAITHAGATYVIVAGGQSNSLSVLRMGAGGALSVVDHIVDGLQTRFAGVNALSIAEANGRIWVAAGGADDGVTLFTLLPNGSLEWMAQIADSTSMGLADVQSIEMQANGKVLDLYVSSATEGGVTHLQATIDGEQIIGTAASDMLVGTEGDDVFFDNAGSDTLTGGAGADVFVFVADGNADTVTDFTLGEDRLDLTGWGLIRNTGQIAFSETPDGLILSYGEETLYLNTTAPIAAEMLSIDDIAIVSRYTNMTMIDNTPPEDPALILDPPFFFCGTIITTEAEKTLGLL